MRDLSILFTLQFCLIYVCPSFPVAQVLSFVCTCGACAQAPTTHLSLQAIIPFDSCHCPDLGYCGLCGFEVTDKSYPLIHYWRRRSNLRHPGYHRDRPWPDRGKEGREPEEDTGEWEGRRAKTWRWEVRSREGNGTEARRVDGRWSILNSSILFLFRASDAEAQLCPALCSQKPPQI